MLTPSCWVPPHQRRRFGKSFGRDSGSQRLSAGLRMLKSVSVAGRTGPKATLRCSKVPPRHREGGADPLATGQGGPSGREWPTALMYSTCEQVESIDADSSTACDGGRIHARRRLAGGIYSLATYLLKYLEMYRLCGAQRGEKTRIDLDCESYQRMIRVWPRCAVTCKYVQYICCKTSLHGHPPSIHGNVSSSHLFISPCGCKSKVSRPLALI